MLNDNAKAKVLAALQPLYADPDFLNVDGDFTVVVNTVPVVVTPPPSDNEQLDVPKP